MSTVSSASSSEPKPTSPKKEKEKEKEEKPLTPPPYAWKQVEVLPRQRSDTNSLRRLVLESTDGKRFNVMVNQPNPKQCWRVGDGRPYALLHVKIGKEEWYWRDDHQLKKQTETFNQEREAHLLKEAALQRVATEEGANDDITRKSLAAKRKAEAEAKAKAKAESNEPGAYKKRKSNDGKTVVAEDESGLLDGIEIVSSSDSTSASSSAASASASTELSQKEKEKKERAQEYLKKHAHFPKFSCFQFIKSGSCDRGFDCPYRHVPISSSTTMQYTEYNDQTNPRPPHKNYQQTTLSQSASVPSSASSSSSSSAHSYTSAQDNTDLYYENHVKDRSRVPTNPRKPRLTGLEKMASDYLNDYAQRTAARQNNSVPSSSSSLSVQN